MKISFGLLVEGLAIVEGLGMETFYGCTIQGLPEETQAVWGRLGRLCDESLLRIFCF